MSDTYTQDLDGTQDLAGQQPQAGPRRERGPSRRHKHHRLVRILIGALASVVVVVGMVAGAGFLYLNHLVSAIPRIHGIAALTAANRPVMPAATRRSMTVLLAGSDVLPSVTRDGGLLGSSRSPQHMSGLIALVHLNALHHGGAVVSIPPNAVVDVPGFGQMQLWKTLSLGGPSLLIQTVEHLTHVRIDHYSVLDFDGATNVVGAMDGVGVTVPFAFTSGGVSFPAGLNHLTSSTVLPYVRQPGVSEIGRVLLEQNLIRAMLTKIAQGHLLVTDVRVLHAVASALSVDSNFDNPQLESLAQRLSNLSGSDGVFVSAPTVDGSPTSGGVGPVHLNTSISNRLWQAIRHDSVAAFAQQYPFTVTPDAPG